MNNKYKQYSKTNFPERLFVLGASPSLELLYPYREQMNEWGHWVIQHAAVIQPFLEFIQPLYNISYASGPCADLNKSYGGIPLEKSLGDVNTGCSIGGFISQFQKFGGKELFLFGYQGGVPSGYWRDQPLDIGVPKGTFWGVGMNPEKYLKECNEMNKIYTTEYTDWHSMKLYHLGKTRYNFMTEISTKELTELI